jgi:O-antigen/teichoic acid export membrane protein
VRRDVLSQAGKLTGEKVNLRRNVLAVFFQTTATALCLFLSYRILVEELGVGVLGIWSLLLSMSALLRAADVSGSSALSRFLAMSPDKRPGELAPVISTLVLTSLAINLVLALIFYVAAKAGISYFMKSEFSAAAHGLLPWIAVLFLLSSMATAIAAGLDGLQRADIRAYIMSGSAVLSLLVTWLLVPRLQATGFAIAQATQQAIIICLGWIMLRRHVSDLGMLPASWSTAILRKTLPFTLSLNLTGIAAMLFEPLAKFALNSSGGPVLVGHFEVANKACAMLRGFAVAAAVPLVPAFATYSDSSDPQLAARISKAHRWYSAFAVIVAVAASAAGPLVSFLVLGKLEFAVVQMAAILAAGWSINLLAAPTYMAAQGQGLMRWNIASHFLLGACVVAGVYFTSAPFVSPVVWAITVGLVLGSLVIVAGNIRAMGNGRLLKPDFPRLFGAAAACVAVAFSTLWLTIGR